MRQPHVVGWLSGIALNFVDSNSSSTGRLQPFAGRSRQSPTPDAEVGLIGNARDAVRVAAPMVRAFSFGQGRSPSTVLGLC